jgi:putative oxidoreductase
LVAHLNGVQGASGSNPLSPTFKFKLRDLEVNMFLRGLGKYSDIGLLAIRVVFGGMFMVYGAPKLFGGPQAWATLGGAMQSVSINFAPAFWGFMACFSMFVGGGCLVLGLFFRVFTILLFITMAVATSMHFKKGDWLFGAAHALEDGIVFLGLTFIGPGKYSLDAFLKLY